MDRVDEGTEYYKNVEILQGMLLNHDEFEAHAKRKKNKKADLVDAE